MGGFSVEVEGLEDKPSIYTLRAATAIRRRERGTRAGGYTIAIVVMQMFTHVQISKIILYHHIPLTVSAQKKYSS